MENMQQSHFIRAFFAVTIPDNIKSKIQDFSISLKRLGNSVRLVDKDKLHITLLFMGDVKQKLLNKLPEDFEAEQLQHTLEIKGAGRFGSRIVWVGCNPIEKLSALSEVLFRETRKVGAHPDTKPFKAHLTVARIKGTIDIEALDKLIEKSSSAVFGKFDVDSFVLFRSDLHYTGSTYTMLKKYSLTR